ncbi:hypothetical protein BT96DRAFT_922256 [Gymnopus androsaceus JB14]|uniref:Uncharacterized protein n=1 Tax=Gymnopus androsaceus JB14 TaxID=1447944 RepID=A0A6A4HHE2_9AGAR|nr:hypothetical protein BT96DRAFT_922256 [Gymnopus androsaceus JB14]
MSTMQNISTSSELGILGDAELVAVQYMISSATTVLVWDILSHLPDDIELLLLPRSFRLPTITYMPCWLFLSLSFLQTGQCIPVVLYMAVGREGKQMHLHPRVQLIYR